ncbi:MAG: hypothetical protein ABIR71_02570 [Chthoniobacterales bacterium]
MLPRANQPDPDLAALAETELNRYCDEHPRSPTAVRRPRIMRRGRSWIALLGSTLEDGVAGMGDTVRAALRSFDVQYRNSSRERG